MHSAQDYLNSFINHEFHLQKIKRSDLKLDRVRKLLHLIGDPQKKLNIIHVAGSKGKGSTAAMMAGILKEAGYRVGLYTSPHLNDYRERIRVLSKEQDRRNSACIFHDAISWDELDEIIKSILPAVEQIKADETLGRLTFFEIYTAIAFYYFRKKNADWVVLETGLGGRLDATNVSEACIGVLTPISLEHTSILGDTIELIAAEKAGIIKESTQDVVVAPQSKEAYKVIKERCRQFSLKPLWVKEKVNSQYVLALKGKHQCVNASTAITVMQCLQAKGVSILQEDIRRGLEQTYWPGRFELIEKKPPVIVDCAHNEASMKSLVETFESVFPEKKVVIIFGTSEDKDYIRMGQSLRSVVKKVIITKANHPRAKAFSEDDARNMFGSTDFILTQTVQEALSNIEPNIDNDIILITGSVFVVSEARNILCTSIKA